MATGLLSPTQDDASDPTLSLARQPNDLIGTRLRYLGDYELIDEIARGGMGIVYRARQVSLNRVVALKLILAGELASEDFVQRFQTEAEAAATLDHPDIVPIYEIGSDDGRYYFSMKLIEGSALAQRLAERTLSIRDAVKIMACVAHAIHYAHQHGVLHRDIKPGNILLDAAGKPWLTDFGLAKVAHRDTSITRTHALMGTPAYMAPEQARGQGRVLTTAADIFSLGAVLYECVTGRPPFAGETAFETLRRVLHHEPPPPRSLNPKVDRDLETICLRCLEKDPSRRYASAEAVGEELERWLRGEPIHARPATPLERTSKWIRRHPLAAGFSFTLLLTLLMGTAGIAYQWRQATHARTATETEAYRAGIALAKSLLERGDRDGTRESLMTLPERLRHWEWGWLMQQCHQERLSLSPWTNMAPEGEIFASSSRDGVWIWNAATGDVQRRIPMTPGEGSTVAYDRTGKWMATISQADSLKVRDAKTGAVFKTATNLFGSALAWHPKDDTLAIAAMDGRWILWDAREGREIRASPGRGMCRGLAFTPDGDRLLLSRTEPIAGTGLPALEVWNPANGQLLLPLEGPLLSYSRPAISPDGRRVFSGDFDGKAALWEAFPWQPGSNRSRPDEPSLSGIARYAQTYSQEKRAAEDRDFSTATHAANPRELFEARDPAIPARCIDLTDHFNYPLDVCFLWTRQTGPLSLNYSKLPRGLHTFTEAPRYTGGASQLPCRGVSFDLRGLVVLADKPAGKLGMDPRLPARAQGIVVKQKASRLHFLHESTITSPAGDIGRYLVHYSDGSTVEIPLRTYQRMEDPSVSPEDRDVAILGWRAYFSTTTSKVIWSTDERAHDGEFEPLLHGYTWTNPHPEKEIVSLDLESHLKGHNIILVAVTAEP